MNPNEPNIYNPEFDTEDGRKSQTCLQYTSNGKFRLIYNRNMSILVIAISGIFLALAIGFFQEIAVPEWDILYPADLWSISHFITGSSIYLFILYISRQEKVALFLSIIITTAYEPFEQIVMFGMLGNTNIIAIIGEEFIWNTVTDLAFNIGGIIVAYYIFHRKPTCTIP